jgi:hypothetical protein
MKDVETKETRETIFKYFMREDYHDITRSTWNMLLCMRFLSNATYML